MPLFFLNAMDRVHRFLPARGMSSAAGNRLITAMEINLLKWH
jgi:hypothetical protein